MHAGEDAIPPISSCCPVSPDLSKATILARGLEHQDSGASAAGTGQGNWCGEQQVAASGNKLQDVTMKRSHWVMYE